MVVELAWTDVQTKFVVSILKFKMICKTLIWENVQTCGKSCNFHLYLNLVSSVKRKKNYLLNSFNIQYGDIFRNVFPISKPTSRFKNYLGKSAPVSLSRLGKRYSSVIYLVLENKIPVRAAALSARCITCYPKGCQGRDS